MILLVKKVANTINSNFKPNGINIVSNIGKDAGQVIYHHHIHIIPRYEYNKKIHISKRKTYTNDDNIKILNKLKESFR